ncbi:MAG: hypothetical protein ABW250_09825 [Pyrinomonadaceae bacterium]
MPRFTGTLTIVGTDSDLSGTPLAKGSAGDVFGEATRFLRQDRGLSSGNRIFVDGTPRNIGGASAISITNAGRELPALVSAGGILRAVNAVKGGESRSARKGGAKKGAAKKGAAKKGAAKKTTKGSRK